MNHMGSVGQAMTRTQGYCSKYSASELPSPCLATFPSQHHRGHTCTDDGLAHMGTDAFKPSQESACPRTLLGSHLCLLEDSGKGLISSCPPLEVL